MLIRKSDTTGEDSLSDAEVVELVRNGDRQRFGLIVKRYQNKLYNYLYRFTHERQTCEDLVSETLVKVYFNLDRCRNTERFPAWLFAIAHNTGVNWWKKIAKEREHTIALEDITHDIPDAGHVDVHEAAVHRDESILMEKALGELEEKYRYPLFLFYYEDFSYEEIAEILNLPLNTVKTHIFRAKRLLQTKIEVLTNEGGFGRVPVAEEPLFSAAPVKAGRILNA
ncbi:MAG: RNA polymerase sigma factor [Parcubacteria group bacterium]|nr:RNA polymerase sigma factor [Parcubacteria group bacterium]